MKIWLMTLAAIALLRAAPAQYTVTPLVTPAGWTSISFFRLNNAGQAVGSGENGTVQQGFIATTSTAIPIPVFPGLAFLNMSGINDAGQVVGWGQLGGANQGFIGTAGGVSALPRGVIPVGLNSAGQVGSACISGMMLYAQPCIVTNSSVTILPLPTGFIGATIPGGCCVINNAGQVAGIGYGSSIQAFIATSGGSTAIPMPRGWPLSADAYGGLTHFGGINSSGQVVGTGNNGTTFQAFIGSGAGSTAIPLPAGGTTTFFNGGIALNDSGTVIGNSDAGNWIWDPISGTRLLNSLLPTGWKVSTVFSINNPGQILAFATSPAGVSASVVLTPQSLPPLGVVASGSSTLASDLVNATTGALSQAQVINGSVGINSFNSVAADPGGRFIYAASSLAVYGYTIDARDGALTPVPGSPYSLPGVTGPALAVAIEASRRFLYVGATNSSPPSILNDILAYSIDPATGALTAVVRVESNNLGAAALVSDEAGKFLYAAGRAGSGGVSVLAIDAATGGLTEIAGSPFGSGFNGNGLAMDPQKRFLFVSGSGPGALAGYAINGATGGLTALTGSPFFFGAASNGVSFDGSGRFLYASQNNTNFLWGFVVDATSGNLTPVPGDPFLCGSGGFACMGVAADASGRYVYAGWEFTVQAYQIDGVTGALTWINGVGPGADHIALVPAAGSPSATLQSLQILPANPMVVSGSTQQFTAEGTYSDGTQRFLTSSVSWSLSNPGVATISNALGQNGLATTIGTGSTTITATLGGWSRRPP